MSGLGISGGSHGVWADVDDIRATAHRLGGSGQQLGHVGSQARGNAAAGVLLRTAVYSPGSAARAEGLLIRSAGGATMLVLRIQAQALFLRTKAQLMVAVQSGGNELAIVGQELASPFVLMAFVDRERCVFLFQLNAGFGSVVADVLSGRTSLIEAPGALGGTCQTAGGATLADAMATLAAHPELTDTVTGGLPRFIHDASAAHGLPFLPTTLQGLTADLQRVIGLAGLGDDRPVSSRLLSTTTSTQRRSLSQTLAGVARLEAKYGPKGEPHVASGVTIQRIGGQPTRWIVEIPGTTQWTPKTNGDPSDLTSNAQLMQQRGALLAALRKAMGKAGIRPGEPVMIAGHSQGGIAAAALAADPAAREQFTITNVLTAGSPIADIPVPRDVHVISIEHVQDPVPRLDGDPNPGTPNWTTVTRDVGDHAGVSTNPIAAHKGGLYADTAKQIPAADQRTFIPFMEGGPSTTREYVLTRLP